MPSVPLMRLQSETSSSDALSHVLMVALCCQLSSWPKAEISSTPVRILYRPSCVSFFCRTMAFFNKMRKLFEDSNVKMADGEYTNNRRCPYFRPILTCPSSENFMLPSASTLTACSFCCFIIEQIIAATFVAFAQNRMPSKSKCETLTLTNIVLAFSSNILGIRLPSGSSCDGTIRSIICVAACREPKVCC